MLRDDTSAEAAGTRAIAAAVRGGLLALGLTAAASMAAPAAGMPGDGVVQLAQTAGAAATGRCAEVRQVEIESREAIGGGVGYGEARGRAIRQALILAVGVAAAPGDPAASGRALDYQTASKQVLAHEVVSERVDRQGGGDSLVVVVRASICAPPRPPARQVIAVGDFLDTSGRPLPGARRQLLDFFATLGKSARFEFTEAHPATAAADIVIAGRLTGAGVTRSGRRLQVRILIEARFLGTGQVITSTDTGKKGIKRGADLLEYIPEAIRRAIERAGPRIYVGIEASPPPQVAARPPPPLPSAPLLSAPLPGRDLVVIYVPKCMESFRHGALAAAGTLDQALLDHVVDSVSRCAHEAWARVHTRRTDWVVRESRGGRRYAALCDRLDHDLGRLYDRALDGSPRDRLRDRILGLCRDELPRRLAVAAP